ncbi:MAG: flavodoxin-dependent (E)-4-hydroxy-3-methylbut-2-enyl-diphosphate synthase, partial [Armatimonadota bacterium]
MTHPSRAVMVGGVQIGGGAPITVQSMTDTDTRDVEATVAQIKELEEAGCDLVRVAVPDMDAASALGRIKSQISLPLGADIHFDHRLALEAIDQGADKLRINPGNIRRPEHIEAVARAAAERGIPIRVGVNSGSVPEEVRARHQGEGDVQEQMAAAMVDA